MSDYELFQLGDIALQSGAALPGARLAYKTYGRLNAEKSNVIVYPTWFSGQHYQNEWLIGPGKALDPANYFIIIPNMFGNGLSSSPSNTPAPCNGPRFPHVTVHDNVRQQHRLVTEKFGITKIKLVLGWSMGGLQAFHWSALYPQMVERLLPFQSAARCSRHNFVFLDGARAALQADAAFEDGWYDAPPTKGLRAFGRVYAGWALSQTFYRLRADIEQLGFASLEDFLVGFWEGMFLSRDANDLLAMLWTWQNADISNNEVYHGDFETALGAIQAKAVVMPSSTDLYFTAQDSAIEVRHMPNAELRVIDTYWGHGAGAPRLSAVDGALIDQALSALLAR